MMRTIQLCKYPIICSFLGFLFLLVTEVPYFSWQKIEAMVIRSEHSYICTPPNSSKCSPVAIVEYEYSLTWPNGTIKKYINREQFKPFFLKSFESQEAEIHLYLQKYSLGNQIEVSYNQKNPEESAIQPFRTAKEWILAFVFLLITSTVVYVAEKWKHRS